MQRIPVDFNSLMRYDNQRIELGQEGTWQGDELPLLHTGERIIVYDEEMEVAGVVEYDVAHHVWLAIPDWSTRRFIEAIAPQTADA
ncbi:MAG: hypothetical protein ABI068_00095 [Ktedonobacterales bacterium]